MSLSQIIYYSRNRQAASGQRAQLELLRAILSASQRNNARDGITGFLLFDRSWFFQILEGERASIIKTYERIQHDPRHTDVTLMALRDTRARSFPAWSMGGAIRSVDQSEIYLRHGISGTLDPTKVTAPTVLALAMDLQDFERAQRLKSADAAA